MRLIGPQTKESVITDEILNIVISDMRMEVTSFLPAYVPG